MPLAGDSSLLFAVHLERWAQDSFLNARAAPIDEEASLSVSNDCDLSWDLYLLPPDHGADVGEWLEEVAAEGHDESEARRHAEAVLARRPELQLGGPFGADYQLTLPESFGLPVDVGLYGNHASISVAYWDLGERTIELGDIVSDIVEALTAVTGWVAYNPQEDRIVRRDELRQLFSAEHAHGVGLIEGLGLAADQSEKPTGQEAPLPSLLGPAIAPAADGADTARS